MLRALSVWMPIIGGLAQVAAGMYVVVKLRQYGRREEKGAAELRAIITAHMQTMQGHMVELLQLHGRVEDLESAVFGDRR